MNPHADMDDYDKLLADDMEYQRPHYGPRETPSQKADSAKVIETNKPQHANDNTKDRDGGIGR